MRLIASFFAIVMALGVFVTSASAATLTGFGGATLSGDSATLVSDLSNSSTADDFSGVDISIPDGMLFSSLSKLSTTYNVTDDDCAGGSPRFQVQLSGPTGTHNLFVYLGPTPSFTGCATGDQDSGNLIESTDARFDLTQFGGPFYGTYADAISLVGSYTVTGVSLVADSGWAFNDLEQTVVVTDPTVGFKVATAKDQCKGGGYTTFTNPTFKNQGQCVAFFASGGKNVK
jgi:hypothetical protein